MTITLRILVSLQVLLSLFTAMVGSFADGGQWWERVALVAIHPVTAVLLLVVVYSRNQARKLVAVTVVFLVLNIVVDLLLAVSIGAGWSKGDWALPLVFLVVPLIALPYCLSRLRSS